ncbi:glycosyltransferase family 4 protein [Blastochloris viridis]|uniref:Capsular glucan synthase n=1 Tax=Blastochloris viridis TaxID=1079 RepID=A0A0H5B7S5_BLAVI|nr:glycosyltransferase family 4 protein [Blastochloris viridis]ALK08486.1 Capsular glucan synthase [Blastochloris viridis]BAR98230.1 glycosyl transferase [Blastochloris viridis]CUU41148.1 Capsular glucan synthase [Blastochloris viridis]
MRIAQIAPLMESVPPRYYGGTERVVHFLTDALLDLGNDVTLFASGDSVTRAELVPVVRTALWLDPAVVDPIPYYMLMLDKVRARAHEFDILHFHIDALHFPLFHRSPHRTVTTLHGRQDLPDLPALYRGFADMPLVSISDAQRTPIADANFIATIHHGLPKDLLHPTFNPRGGYLAFLGRISPEKGPVEAIRLARALGLPLRIAAKVDRVDECYFREMVRPEIAFGDDVEFIGEIGDRDKAAFLGEARALLFPIDWPEPFGLVMIEAMACGTPVLAFRAGSVPEVIEDRVTGRIVEDFDEALLALPEVLSLDRRRIRAEFESRFTAERMARDYLGVYRTLTRPIHTSPMRQRATPWPSTPAAPLLQSGAHAG